jgi:uncharacterized protein (TIGR03067 family)
MVSRFVSPLLLTAVAVAAAQAADPPGAKEAAALQGTWKLVSVEKKGDVDDLGRGQPRWIIKDNKLRYGGAEVAVLNIDPSTTPQIIDFAAVDPKQTFEGIYKLEKNTLTICLNARSDVKERPSDFKTKDKESLRLLVLERLEKAEKDETEGTSAYVGIMLGKDAQDPTKVAIDDTLEGSPGKKAGLKKGDVLVTVSGVAPADLRTAVALVRQSQPGQDLVLRVKRDGKEMDVTVKTGILPWKWLVDVK